MVRITLFDRTGNALPQTRALVDSGADSSMFPVSLLAALGISTSDCQQVSGQGAAGAGNFLLWSGGKIKARVAKWNVELTPFFGNPAIILLGRDDFFAAFKSISFDERSRTFVLEGL